MITPKYFFSWRKEEKKILLLRYSYLTYFNDLKHLFNWSLYARNWFFTAHVTFGLKFPIFNFQSSTDSLVSYLYLLILNNLLLFAYPFLNVFSLIPFQFLVCNSFCHIPLSLYTRCFLGRNFRLRGSCFYWYSCIFGCSGLSVYLIFFCYMY